MTTLLSLQLKMYKDVTVIVLRLSTILFCFNKKTDGSLVGVHIFVLTVMSLCM